MQQPVTRYYLCLLRSYAAYYDVEPMEAQEPLVATAFFHVHGTGHVLSKRRSWGDGQQ